MQACVGGQKLHAINHSLELNWWNVFVCCVWFRGKRYDTDHLGYRNRDRRYHLDDPRGWKRNR